MTYIHIFVRHLKCKILKAISGESVGWTKAILIHNFAEREREKEREREREKKREREREKERERAIEFYNCILFLESNHGCLFTPATILFRNFSTWFDAIFSIVHPTLSFLDFSS